MILVIYSFIHLSYTLLHCTSITATKGIKRKRIVLDIPTKLRILDRLENGEKAVDIASEFGVGNSTVSDIKAAKNKLREFMANSDTDNMGR